MDIDNDILEGERTDENIVKNLKSLHQSDAEVEFLKAFEGQESGYIKSKEDVLMVRWWDEGEVLVACRVQEDISKYAILVYDLAASDVQQVISLFDNSGAMIVNLLHGFANG